MHSREPELLSPLETDFLAGFPELVAVVGAALPGAAGKSSGERIFGCHKKQAAARFENSQHLAQAGSRVGQVLDDPAAGDAVETAVGERKILHVGRDKLWTVALQSLPRTVQHVGREVARDDFDVVAGLPQDVAEDLTGPRAHVEDAAKPGDVKLPGSQHMADQWVVQRNHTA